VTRKFERFGARTFRANECRSAGLRWREIDTAFESRIMTGAVINFKHIELHQFHEDARENVLVRVRTVMTKYDNIKINTIFNDEFVAGDKRANKKCRHEKLRTLLNILQE